MKIKKIDSSMIEGFHHSELNNMLFVEFKSGDTYMYYDFKRKHYKKLINAESVGRAFNAIKENYTFVKVVKCSFPYDKSYENNLYKLDIINSTLLLYTADNKNNPFIRIDMSSTTPSHVISALLPFGFIIN